MTLKTSTDLSHVDPASSVTSAPMHRFHLKAAFLVGLVVAVVDIAMFAATPISYPLDIDEAGYALFAAAEARALHFGGLHAWISAIHLYASQAPLVPALNSLIAFFIGLGNIQLAILPTIGHVLGAFSATLLLSLFIPRLPTRIASGVAISMVPGLLWLAQVRIFAEDAAGLVTTAVALMIFGTLRKQKFLILLAFSFMGLGILSRSMVIAFLPAFFIAYIILELMINRGAIKQPPQLIKLLATLVVGTSLIGIEILLGYWQQTITVYRYLTGYGYGAQGTLYASGSLSLFSLSHLKDFINYHLENDFLLPFAIVGILGMLLLFGWISLSHKHLGNLLFRYESSHSEERAVAVALFSFVSISLLALLSTLNIGFGFLTPLLPIIGVLLAIGLTRGRGNISSVGLTALLTAALISGIPIIADRGWFRVPILTAPIPLFGQLPVWNSQGQEQGYFVFDHLTPQNLNVWQRDLEILSHQIIKASSQAKASRVIFGAQDHLINTNSLGLLTIRDNFVMPSSVITPELEGKPTCRISHGEPICIANLSKNIAQYISSLELPPDVRTIFVVFSSSNGNFQPTLAPSIQKNIATKLGDTHIQFKIELPNNSSIEVLTPA